MPANEFNSRGTLSDEEVRHLRHQHKQGKVTVRMIGKMYDLGPEAVRRMLRGETYRWVKEEDDQQANVASSLARLNSLLAAEAENKRAADNVIKEIEEDE